MKEYVEAISQEIGKHKFMEHHLLSKEEFGYFFADWIRRAQDYVVVITKNFSSLNVFKTKIENRLRASPLQIYVVFTGEPKHKHILHDLNRFKEFNYDIRKDLADLVGECRYFLINDDFIKDNLNFNLEDLVKEVFGESI